MAWSVFLFFQVKRLIICLELNYSFRSLSSIYILNSKPISIIMASVLNHFINTVCHITIDGQTSEKYYLITHYLMLLQTISTITDTRSTLYFIVKWADPSTFLDAQFTVIVCFVITMSFLLLFMLELKITEDRQMLAKPSISKIYLGNVLVHLQILCKTVVMAPLIRSSLFYVQNPSIESMKPLALLSLIIYLLFLLPLSIYNTSNTFILTPQINKKLNYINIYLILNIFRVVFAFASAINESSVPIFCAIFFLIFVGTSIKQPILCFSHERIIKGIISAIAYITLWSILQSLIKDQAGWLPIQLIGMVSFIILVDWQAQCRIRKILELKQPTIHQIKVLIYLITNIQEEIYNLEYFIIAHHKHCDRPNCRCKAVIQHLTSAQEKLGSDRIWFEFLISYIGNYYCLERIAQMPQSERVIQVAKYQQIVVALAEMHLFKMGVLNASYFILSKFRHFLKTKGVSFVSFQQKQRVINYYMQQAILAKYHTEGVINLNADKFMVFQIEAERYRKLLLRSAKKASEMWQQMNKRQPDDVKLRQSIEKLGEWHQRICRTYLGITKTFDNSADILADITNDYFKLVLNIQSQSPFHVIKIHKFKDFLNRRKDTTEKLSAEIQSFSLGSPTPMCFVSVQQHSFGKIVGNNHFFNEIMQMQLGSQSFVEDFMIPEIRESHRQSMKAFVNGDQFSAQHKSGVILNTKGKIVYSKILVQIMPSIEQGLRYAFFMKKLMPFRKILGIKKNTKIVYSSQSFDDSINKRITHKPVVSYFTEKVISDIIEKKEVQMTIEETNYTITFMHEFSNKEIEYIFVEFIEDLRQTNDKSLNERTMESNKGDDANVLKKRTVKLSFMSQQGNFMEDSKGKAEAMKQEAEISNVFSIIVDDSRKSISRRLIVFTLVILVLFTAALLISVFLKQSHQATYLQARDINSVYVDFMKLMTTDIIFIKLTNTLASAQVFLISQAIFNSINQTSIIAMMDRIVVNFDISSITQMWTTLTCNSKNGTFTIGKLSNFLAIADYFQNPFNNLMATPIKGFAFPFSMKYQPLPLTGIVCKFNELVTNGLYIIMPKFRALKENEMNTITLNRVDTKDVMLSVYLIQIVLILVFVFGILFFNKRIANLKDHSYQLFESMDRQLIKEKETNCNWFIASYTEFEDKDIENKAYDNQRSQIMRDSQVSLIKTESDERTDHCLSSIPLNIRISNQYQIQNGSDLQQSKIEENRNMVIQVVRTTKSQIIFTKSSFVRVFLKHCLPIIPLLLFSAVFAGLQVGQVDTIKKHLKIQDQIQNLHLDFNQLFLYSQQYGLYDGSLQEQLNIPRHLNSLIDEIYKMERAFVGFQYDLSQLPLTKQFMNAIAYNDLCVMHANGEFLNYSRKQVQNLLRPCLSLINKRLTKGFYSSIIDFLNNAHTLIMANPDPISLNMLQRSNYLNSRFFNQEGPFIMYFDNILYTMRCKFVQDYANQIQNSTNLLVYTTLVLLGVIFLTTTVFGYLYIQNFKLKMVEITSIFMLISYDSLVKDEGLKNRFTDKREQFKKLK